VPNTEPLFDSRCERCGAPATTLAYDTAGEVRGRATSASSYATSAPMSPSSSVPWNRTPLARVRPSAVCVGREPQTRYTGQSRTCRTCTPTRSARPGAERAVRRHGTVSSSRREDARWMPAPSGHRTGRTWGPPGVSPLAPQVLVSVTLGGCQLADNGTHPSARALAPERTGLAGCQRGRPRGLCSVLCHVHHCNETCNETQPWDGPNA
jgi:hypothetical protein